MKRLLKLFLSLNFLVVPVAYARASGSAELAARYTFMNLPKAFQTLRGIGDSSAELDKSLQKLSASRPAEVTAHVGQTLLFLLTVTGIDLVYQELKKNHETEAAPKEHLLELAGSAAKQILNSGNTWASMSGAGLASGTLDYPITVLTTLIADPQANKLLFETLRGSILTTGAFIGWDAGAQLWTEASYLLEDAEDFERSKSLFGMGSGALRALLVDPAPQDEKDLRLVKLMFANVLKVAILDQELRAAWMSNLWRTRLMTGEVATLLTSVIVASAVGTMILPGGGTVVGFMFGVGGVAVALAIPQFIKNDITIGLQNVRSRVVARQLTWNFQEISSVLQHPDRINPAATLKQIEDLLERR
ncbi:MAG: hypothetical protein ACXVA9_11560, partial [Bdellovibrionales bacterium]